MSDAALKMASVYCAEHRAWSGGAYLDGTTIRVLVVSGMERHVAPLRDLLPTGTSVLFEPVANSMEVLEAAQHRIAADLPEMSTAGIQCLALGVSVPENRVKLLVAPSQVPAAEEWLKGKYPSLPVVVQGRKIETRLVPPRKM